MLNILDAFNGLDYFFVTFNTETTKDLPKLAKTIYIRNFKGLVDPAQLPKVAFFIFTIIYFMRVILPCFEILYKEKPDVILSTGGGVTVPLCFLGKLLGIKIIYVESLARINGPSLTGRIIYLIADLFLIQWKSLQKYYKNAKYWGRVI